MFSKKLFILYIVLLSIAICVMGMLIYYKPVKILPRDYPEIKAEGILRIVTEYNQSGYYISGDETEGFQYELCRTIAELSGLEVQMYLEMSLEKSFRGLYANQCDIIAQNIPTTSELKKEYLFTDPVVLNKQVLVQRTAEENNGVEPIRNQLDLAKKTLYVPENSPALLRLRNLQHEIGDTIYIIEEPLYSSEQLIIMVAKGDIAYAVCDQQIARTSQKQLPEIDILTDISFTQLQSWAVRKTSPALLDSLNQWFRIIRENGTYDKIYKKYYHQEN
ncbi:MAG: transporter substrate-binding domain-containing protein [Tannerella sp.]|jgi:membrane-bound lytic murein transglycosylase MltF|nr:transporter substrate-binding domain-containing protein [Tannerella sp.]